MDIPKHINDKILKTDNCWFWTGNINGGGYGTVSFRGKQTLAHRAVYTIYKGEIPNGLVIDHLCRVRNCVNPAHLEPVTQKENTARGVSPSAVYARRTKCSKGHTLDTENTIINGGRRRCATCYKEYHDKYRLDNKDKIRDYHRLTNRDRKEYMDKYYSNPVHKAARIEYMKEYNKNRRSNDKE